MGRQSPSPEEKDTAKKTMAIPFQSGGYGFNQIILNKKKAAFSFLSPKYPFFLQHLMATSLFSI